MSGIPEDILKQINQKIISDLKDECLKKNPQHSDDEFNEALRSIARAKDRYVRKISDTDAPNRELVERTLKHIDEALAELILADPKLEQFRDDHGIGNESDISHWINRHAAPYIAGELPSLADYLSDDSVWDRATYLLWQARREFLKRRASYVDPKADFDEYLGLPEINERGHLPHAVKILIADFCEIWSAFDPDLGLPSKDSGKDNPTLRFIEICCRYATDDNPPGLTTLHHQVSLIRKRKKQADDWSDADFVDDK